jgi:hypothetical protein
VYSPAPKHVVVTTGEGVEATVDVKRTAKTHNDLNMRASFVGRSLAASTLMSNGKLVFHACATQAPLDLLVP